MALKISPGGCLKGSLEVGADKSITHRAIILSSLSPAQVKIKNFYPSQDCLETVKAMQALGVSINTQGKDCLRVKGVGLSGLSCPARLVIGNSGTTYRLLTGILAAQDAQVILEAGQSLSRRPMKRIVEPLSRMGVRISALKKSSGEVYPPLKIKGNKDLKAIRYSSPVASAQVKSAILLAGLYAHGLTIVVEKIKARDHTERMLKLFKAPIRLKTGCVSLYGPVKKLQPPAQLVIPGDFSSAAFFIVAALLLPGSKIILKNININPTRIGLLKVLKRMGANIKTLSQVHMRWPVEPVADIIISYSRLKATTVRAGEIPLLIDEVPILMVAASLAKGLTRICAVSELKVKETDRISSMLTNLRRMGAVVHLEGKDIIIKGVKELKGSHLKTYADHRTAMALSIAALCAREKSVLDDASCVSKSFPDFFKLLDAIVTT